jgi:haloalkane dehalogenase
MKEYLIKNLNSTIRYHDLEGDEKPILFIHGLGCTSSFDYPQAAAMNSLIKHRRVLIDLLGSGYSDKPEDFRYTMNDHARYLKEFIDDLDLTEIILYGHSMGGSIAISLAAQCTERINCLIISEANLDAGGGFFSKKIASYTETDYVKEGHGEIIAESKKDSNTKWAVGLENSYPIAINREARSLVEGQIPGWRELFYRLKIKKTFIFGENSLPEPDLEELKKHDIHIEIVKNAGHSMAWENPEGLSKAIQKGADNYGTA